MNASFRKRLAEGKLLCGTIVTLPSPEIVEIFSQAGVDWLFVDLEHSAMTIRDAQRLLQAAGTQTPCLVRVPANDETWIKRGLDIGAAGIIVPMVNSASDAGRAVQAARYPPTGSRSVGIARAQQYGQKFKEYVDTANDDIAVIVQIEHIDAVESIEKIAAIEGVDGLFVGPYDLSASMGKTGRTTDPAVVAAIARVTTCAAEAGLPLGIFGANADAVSDYIADGYTLIAVGIDTLLIGRAAGEIVGTLKP